jgi:hypothetical protein
VKFSVKQLLYKYYRFLGGGVLYPDWGMQPEWYLFVAWPLLMINADEELNELDETDMSFVLYSFACCVYVYKQ